MDAVNTLKFVEKKLSELRFAGLDQNPHGIRDLLYSAISKVEAKDREIDQLKDFIRGQANNANNALKAFDND